MKAKIHPQWYPNAQVLCACGTTFTIGSTKENIRVEICSKCHPFFTGEMKFVDTMGRVDRFQQKQKIAKEQKAHIASKRQKKLERQEQIRSPKSLREMLLGS
ncbi:50S ribosomal protein L31 [Candidatus Gottesmanbacteria bacterium]|nr:50S ribosomal protein L31 [Candidatus Gottesmanbacteria bacterium]